MDSMLLNDLREIIKKYDTKSWEWGDKNLSCLIKARLTESDYFKLKELARKENLSLSKFLRKIILNAIDCNDNEKKELIE